MTALNEIGFDLLVILDNSVMNKNDVTGPMRVGVLGRRYSMGRPACEADSAGRTRVLLF